MNEATLRNLSDWEFLKSIRPTTALEVMLAERLESPEGDPEHIERLYDQLSAAEEAQGDAEYRLEEAQADLEALKDYAKKLHAALSELSPDNELLDDDGSELLR